MEVKDLIDQEVEIEPNFIQVGLNPIESLFWDCFMYIDKKEYVFDEILGINNIPVKFINPELSNSAFPDYVLVSIKCRKAFSQILIHTLFPKLHEILMEAEGEPYLKFCEFTANMLLEKAPEVFVKTGDTYENISR